MESSLSRIRNLEKISRLLDPPPTEISKWFETLSKFSEQFLGELETAPSWRKQAPHSQPPSSLPGSFENALTELAQRTLSDGIETAGNRYFSYIPGGGISTAAFGDFFAALTNRFTGMFHASPGAVSIENEMIQFFLDLFSFPSTAWGNLTSGGSLANLTALQVARESRPRTKWDRSTVYMTEHYHSCGTRAIRTLGLNPDLVRIIPVNSKFQMDMTHLKKQMNEDQERGLIPWIVMTTLGTTSTGSVDSIHDALELKKDYPIWLHVDAAYGGFFVLTESCRKIFERISEVDSLVIDPHKSLFMPYGCGAVLVRNGYLMKQAFSAESADLSDLKDPDAKSPTDYSCELSRPSRAPRIFLSLKTFGIEPFRAALEEKLELAQYAYTKLKENPLIEFACEPELSAIAFRIRGPDTLTQDLLDLIVQRGRVHLSSTRLHGNFYLRICVLNFRSHLKQVDECLSEIEEGITSLQ